MTQHITQELLPCPFCGSTEQTYDNCDHGSGQWYTCEGCGVQVKVHYRQDLEEAWNRRAALAQPASVDSIDTSMERVEKDAGNGWKPIESAPKSSKAILVHCEERKNTYAATWVRDEEFPWSGKWKHFGGNLLNEKPTHWMPLPPAPTGEPNE